MKKLLKFGGSSIANADRIQHVCNIIHNTMDSGESITVVVSAIKGITDNLIILAENAAKGQESNAQISALIDFHKKHILELEIESDSLNYNIDALAQ